VARKRRRRHHSRRHRAVHHRRSRRKNPSGLTWLLILGGGLALYWVYTQSQSGGSLSTLLGGSSTPALPSSTGGYTAGPSTGGVPYASGPDTLSSGLFGV
jgi:hypothetical protein